jgi:hypothetical protein
MKLSILIVNWNTRDLVTRCIDSILHYPPDCDYEVIVVDNHSLDGSAEALFNLSSRSKQIRIIKSFQNFGFAKGNNLAYQNSSGEYVLLLNPDTQVREGALEGMVEYLESHPEIGVLGPKLLNPDGTIQHSVRRFPGIFSAVAVFAGLHRLIPLRQYLMPDFNYEKTAGVDQVMGAAFLTRRKVIEELGSFLDENFWLWYEEVDFCRRIKAAGYKIVYYPGAEIRHEGAGSFAQMSIYERKKTAAKSLAHYFEKNGSRGEVMVLRIVIPVVMALAWIAEGFERIFRVRHKIKY